MQNSRLDKIFSFGIQKTFYKLELTVMWYPSQLEPVWGLAVRHTEWATHLAELESLPVGCQANWGRTLQTFLPDDGLSSCASPENTVLAMAQSTLEEEHKAPHRNGIRILMEKLIQISELVSSTATAQGGVPIR